jgi:putative salt-induced outer membrane protein YdiY
VKPAPAADSRKWAYELAVAADGKTGNTEKANVGGSFKATLSGAEDKLKIYVKGAFTRENGEKTVEEILGGIDFEQNLAGNHTWYARMEMERDKPADLELRATAGAGYGYYFLRKDDHELRGRIGAQYERKAYETQDDDSSTGLDVGLYHMIRVTDWSKVVTSLTYTPSFQDWHNYLIRHETSIDMPMGQSPHWVLRLGVSNDYTSRPSPGIDRLDTSWFSQVVYSF